MSMTHKLCLCILSAALFGCAVVNPHAGQPRTTIQTVTDEYHGTAVKDDYRWLEDWDDQAVKVWSESQNTYARSVLDGLGDRAAIRERVAEIVGMMPSTYGAPSWSGGKLFALKLEPPRNQPVLVVLPSPEETAGERVIVDPNELDEEGGVHIDWYVPSPDGSRVAVSLSWGGSESGDVHVYDVEGGKGVGEVIKRVNGGTAGGDLGWTPDGKGFYYTRYPREGERAAEDMSFYQELWFHQLGTPETEDRYELGKGLPRIAEIEVDMHPDGRVLATVQHGDSGRFAFFVRLPSGRWKQFAGFDDGVVEAIFGPGERLFLVSRKKAPRGKIYDLASVETPLGQARRIVAESSDTIHTQFYGSRTLVATETRLYVTYQLGGPSEVRAFNHDGRRQADPEVPPVSAVGGVLVPLEGDDLLFSTRSFIEPTTWRRFRAADKTTTVSALGTRYPIDFGDIEVVRDFAKSFDGTKVPINILKPRGLRLNGQNPTLLTGYGGFGVSRSPRFDPLRRIWFDHGGVYAVANLRGGGEYGAAWHEAGTKTRKQNVFDDFHACMKYLDETGHANPERLVIEGGSNGGLLMGAMITQHPAAARAVVSHVGIYDMLRVELSENGKFNIPEYGTVENPGQFQAMYKYSPYHAVEDGVIYPAVLFLTGANDPRVDPMHSRKMTARLQAANVSDNPVLLRTSSNTGHGIGAPLSERIEKRADVLAFIFEELEIPFGAGQINIRKTDGVNR